MAGAHHTSTTRACRTTSKDLLIHDCACAALCPSFFPLFHRFKKLMLSGQKLDYCDALAAKSKKPELSIIDTISMCFAEAQGTFAAPNCGLFGSSHHFIAISHTVALISTRMSDQFQQEAGHNASYDASRESIVHFFSICQPCSMRSSLLLDWEDTQRMGRLPAKAPLRVSKPIAARLLGVLLSSSFYSNKPNKARHGQLHGT